MNEGQLSNDEVFLFIILFFYVFVEGGSHRNYTCTHAVVETTLLKEYNLSPSNLSHVCTHS